MILLARKALSVRILPFALLLPLETLFYVDFVARRAPESPAPQQLAFVIASGLAIFGLQVLLVLAWRRWAPSMTPRLFRSTRGSVLAYVVISFVGVSVQILLYFLFTGELPGGPFERLVFAVSRPASIVVLAIVIDEFLDGWRTSRRARHVLVDRLTRLQRVNSLLVSAEESLRREAVDRMSREVAAPLDTLVEEGPRLQDEELADRLDLLLSDTLRPLAHHLHPVTVRLGLAASIRALGPDVSLYIDPVVERLDSDGFLLDEDVRLQAYRWVRDSVYRRGPVRVAIAILGRNLRIRLVVGGPELPPREFGTDLDAVQSIAGLRTEAEGVLVVPLRGQIPPPADLVIESSAGATGGIDEPASARLDPARVLTVPLPYRLLFVALMSLGASTQLVLTGLPVSWQSLLCVATGAAAALAVTAILEALPRPRPTGVAAATVILGWGAVGLAAGLGFEWMTLVLDLRSPTLAGVAANVLVGCLRFTLPGVALTIAHGLVVVSREALRDADSALAAESARQVAILEESRRLYRDVAEALHRTVQGRLAAAVVLLRLGRRPEAWAELVRVAADVVPRLLLRLEGPAESRYVVSGEVPSGLIVHESMEVEQIPPELAVELRRAVAECGVNALRHGRAGRLWVTVCPGPVGLRVSCRDDGLGLAGAIEPGLGSRVLDEIADRWGGTWTLLSEATGCVVIIDVATSSIGGAHDQQSQGRTSIPT